MARNLSFTIQEKIHFEASITKIEREKIYGYVEDLTFDKENNPCILGNLLDDGKTLFVNGSTALKTINKNREELDKKSLITVNKEGREAQLVPSSYDHLISLEKIDMNRLFDLEVQTSYQLVWEDASAKQKTLDFVKDQIYSFIFNYRADYEGADAILLSNKDDIFILTGRFISFEYLDNQSAILIDYDDEEVEETELDFSMF